MKRALLSTLAAGLLMLFVAGPSLATTITYVEVYNPADILVAVGGVNSSVSWTFDLTDNPGWSTPGQVFSGGTISLNVYDDGGPGDSNEKATFTFEAGTGLIDTNINSALWSGLFTVDASAFTDGWIGWTLTATSGDFYFGSATLNAASEVPGSPITPAATPVPEPSTVVLLGSGLLGLIYMGRRKLRK